MFKNKYQIYPALNDFVRSDRFGMDLVSLNMQRGREFGVPGYMEFRKFCGLPASNTWDEMLGTMPNETIRRYASIFE